MTNLYYQIGAVLLTAFTTLVVAVVYFIRNPEKLEVLASLFWRLVAFLSIENEKRYVSTNIQSIVAVKRKNPDLASILPYGLNVKWIKEDEASAELRDNEVLVMMKQYQNQAKNVANIVSLYVPKTMLPISRRYVDEQVINSMDYVIGKTLLQSNTSALEIFIHDHNVSEDEEMKIVVEQIEDIHKTGHLSRILVPSFHQLAAFHPQEPNDDVLKESYDYFLHLHEFETDTSHTRNGIFNGDVIKSVVVPIARQETVNASGVMAHIGFIRGQLDEGITNVFLVATARNIDRAIQVQELVEAHFRLNTLSENTYDGYFRGRSIKMICVHMTL